MAYVITSACIGHKEASCVDACPVDAIHEGEEQYYIDPDRCIDCGVCETECPFQAIYVEDLIPEEEKEYILKNASFFM